MNIQKVGTINDYKLQQEFKEQIRQMEKRIQHPTIEANKYFDTTQNKNTANKKGYNNLLDWFKRKIKITINNITI